MLKIKIKYFYIKLILFLNLFKILFSKKQIIRQKIFDALPLHHYFEFDNLNLLVKNNKKNESIDFKVNVNENLAILFPGRLRCWEYSKEFVNSLSKKFKIFIITDISDKEKILSLNNKNIHNIILEESKYKNYQKEVNYPGQNQYLKLKVGILEILDYEKKHNINFKNFIKLRTDYQYYDPKNLINMNRENNENCLFAKSDILFSGRREFFIPLMGVFEFSNWMYLSNFQNLEYLPINPYQIKESDFGSFKFNWLKLPSKVVGKNLHSKVSAELIKKKVENNFEKFLKFYPKLGEEYKEAAGKGYFPSEQSFAHFINLSGIRCKTHFKFSGHLMHEREQIESEQIMKIKNFREQMKKIKN